MLTIIAGLMAAFAPAPMEQPGRLVQRSHRQQVKRRDELRKRWDKCCKDYSQGRALNPSQVLAVGWELLNAELLLTTLPAKRLAVHKEYVFELMEIEATAKARYEAGRISHLWYLTAKFGRRKAVAGWQKAGGMDMDRLKEELENRYIRR